MKRLAGSLIVAVNLLALSSVAFACSASDSLDVARTSRDTDSYKAARDVAKEFVDSENWTRDVSASVGDADEVLTDSGAGTLLMESAFFYKDRSGYSWGMYYLDSTKGSISRAEFEAILDQPAQRSFHGLAADGTTTSVEQAREIMAAGGVSPTSVANHMRLHISETRDALLAGSGGLSFDKSLQDLRDAYAADAASPAPVTSTPAPSTVEEPAPEPIPVEIIHHAG